MIGRLFRFALLILLTPLIAAFVYEAALFLSSIVTFDGIKWFLVGMAVYFIFYAIVLQNRIVFLEALAHEMEHAIMGLIRYGELPTRMTINTEGKSETVRSQSGCVTKLAPYCFHPFAILFLMLKAAMAVGFHLLDASFPVPLDAVLDALIGLTLGFHYVCLIREFSPRQTDFQSTGMAFSMVMVLFLNLLFLVFTLAVVTNSYADLWPYVKDALRRTGEAYRIAMEVLKTHILPAARSLFYRFLLLFCPECAPPF
jgi:hypothetical protein